MAAGLKGCVPTSPKGKRICFNYNLGKCPVEGDSCEKGLHGCTSAGSQGASRQGTSSRPQLTSIEADSLMGLSKRVVVAVRKGATRIRTCLGLSRVARSVAPLRHARAAPMLDLANPILASFFNFVGRQISARARIATCHVQTRLSSSS